MDLDEKNLGYLGGWYTWVSTKGEFWALVEVYTLLTAIQVCF